MPPFTSYACEILTTGRLGVLVIISSKYTLLRLSPLGAPDSNTIPGKGREHPGRAVAYLVRLSLRPKGRSVLFDMREFEISFTHDPNLPFGLPSWWTVFPEPQFIAYRIALILLGVGSVVPSSVQPVRFVKYLLVNGTV